MLPSPWNAMPEAREGRNHGAPSYARDVSVPEDTPIPSPVDGVVVYRGWVGSLDGAKPSSGGWGIVIRDESAAEYWMMLHGDGVYLVALGVRVRRGQSVMQSGNSGYSFGPHVHVERWHESMPGRWFPKGVFIDPFGVAHIGAALSE